jgi:predicted nucleotidyltransferase
MQAAPPSRETADGVANFEAPETRALGSLLASATLQARRVVGVWLFGSRGNGTATVASDIDLGVLCAPPLGLSSDPADGLTSG